METSAAEKNARLYTVGILAAVLPLISFCSLELVRHFNRLFGRQQADTVGWTMYTGLRLLLFAAMVLCIVSLRSPMDPESVLAERPAQERRREPSYDPLLGLRALAALMVFLGHYFLVIFSYDVPPHGLQALSRDLLVSCPWAGVWVFFTLSGYLMAKGFAVGRYAFTPASVFAFYRNRFLRIMPLYVGAIFFVALFTAPGIFHPSNWWQLVEMLTFDFSGHLPNGSNGALWSVSTEVQFYFLVPFLFPAVRAVAQFAGRAFILLLPVVLLCGTGFRMWIAYKFGKAYWVYGYSPLLPNLGMFLVGMGLTQLAPGRSIPFQWRSRLSHVFPVLTLAIFCFSAFCTARYYEPGDLTTRLHMFEFLPPLMCVLAAAYILAAQAVVRVPLGTGLRAMLHRSIMRIGILTYAFYVLHSPILGAFRTTFPAVLPQATSLLFFPLAFILVWLASEAAYRFVEEPFERARSLPAAALSNAP